MKRLLKILIILCLLGAIREGAMGLFPERWARSVLIPVLEYSAETHTGVCMLETPQGDVRLTVESTSPVDAPTDQDELLIEEAGQAYSFPVHSEESISIAGGDYVIEQVRPWSGVLPNPSGLPLMSISVATEEGSWVENQPLSVGGTLVAGNVKIALHHLGPNQSLSDLLQQHLAEQTRGRWGIYDGKQTLWFDDFTPGSGAEDSDGTLFTLIAFTPTFKTNQGSVPAIRVRVKQGDTETDRIITTRSIDSHVVLEHPDKTVHQVDIGIFGLDAPQVIVRTLDGRTEQGALAPGHVWESELLDLWLREENFTSSGVFVRAADSPFMEAVLVGDGKRLRVRQGEAVRVGDSVLRYHRILPEGAIRYTIHLEDPAWTSPELKAGDVTELTLFGHRCLVRYENIDMSRGVDVEILPRFSAGRFVCFLGIGILLVLSIRLSASKSLSDDLKSL